MKQEELCAHPVVDRTALLQKAGEWRTRVDEDPDIQAEVERLIKNNDMEELSEHFSRPLEFGTGGLRGVLGAGTHRMNIYTVSQATQGLANYLRLMQRQSPKVAIAYDSRMKSGLFARHAARVLTANGVAVFLYPRIMPTPALSFAVRCLGCDAGICITASHNPAIYNGYKVYGPDGCQITVAAATAIQKEILSTDLFDGVHKRSFEESLSDGSVTYIPQSTVERYLDAVASQRLTADPANTLSIVYTPLNGTGLECVARILNQSGIRSMRVVLEQEFPDAQFPTCPSPNPENEDAMRLGMKLCVECGADLLLATDPDCDRVGVAVREGDRCVLLSGNEVGILLLDYICRKRTQNATMPKEPVAIKSIVTTDMAEPVCREYGVALQNVLTGFKFIGEAIGQMEAEGRPDRYIFGFEESCGYLSGGYVRDKDAVAACMLICDMAGEYMREGVSLLQAMDRLYRKHGYYLTLLDSVQFPGETGFSAMQAVMQNLRRDGLMLEGLPVPVVCDYLWQEEAQAPLRGAPPSDVLEFRYGRDIRITVRPSGTEPKLKIYYSVRASSRSDAMEVLRNLQTQVLNKLQLPR